MSARTHPRSQRQAPGGVEVHLPWWAIALPSLAFAALLLLIVGPGQAHATTSDPAIGRLIGRLMAALTP
ncbi:hypothetical protein ACPXCE_13715 [Streptomyces sp. DT24]|uniref:hypothetical protein n=1 Tax=unclassified Streptomyces TaxID=2593676 RepID=UPI0023B995DE|nr:hypothetical protein [Streptomyces sp. AM 4-1-1]WEH32753.1 hypothetical protein PZB75_04800 [Streptomyces sp. AM 4-1-1]